jgi:hypothetical protein
MFHQLYHRNRADKNKSLRIAEVEYARRCCADEHNSGKSKNDKKMNRHSKIPGLFSLLFAKPTAESETVVVVSYGSGSGSEVSDVEI